MPPDVTAGTASAADSQLVCSSKNMQSSVGAASLLQLLMSKQAGAAAAAEAALACTAHFHEIQKQAT
jgi:hypothetical protein